MAVQTIQVVNEKVRYKVSTVRWTNREVFNNVLALAMVLHPVMHDNGNQVVMKIHRGELTMVRQTMEEEIRIRL